jgi:acyl carrier protein
LKEEDIKNKIIKFINDDKFQKGKIIDSKTDLFNANVLDSLKILELVMFLENEFNFSISENELIEDLIKEYSNGEIIILDKKNISKKPEEELVTDVLQIMNVYVAKMNGLRRYKKK